MHNQMNKAENLYTKQQEAPYLILGASHNLSFK